jgi:glycosyltransferase involved in cell wall biosynthesis
MKILQVCPGYYVSGVGGVSEHVLRVSEGLVKQGHDVTVYGTNPGQLASSEVVNGVKVRRFNMFAPSGAYFFSLEMALTLRRAKFDLVHGHGYHALPVHFSSLAECKKLVVTAHFHGAAHSAFRKPLFKLFAPLGKMILEKADNIIAVSDFEKSLLCEKFGLKSQKITVVPNGVDLNEFTSYQHHESNFKSILYVGRLEKYKGIQYVLEVLPKLSDDVILKIVGNGSLKGFLENRAKELKVQDRVFFYQNLPRKELLQKYIDADVLILLSRYEAYSLVVAEALASGTPCILAKTSALAEWVDNKSCFGLDFPIKKHELVEIISDVFKARFSNKIFKAWLGNKIYDWDDIVKQIEKIYFENS